MTVPSPRRRFLQTSAALTAGGVFSPWVQAATPDPIRVGVTTGPHEQIFAVVKRVAERDHGLKIRVVSFNDYVQPNAALDAGDLDANSFQHRPFLAAAIRARNYRLVGFGKTWVGPIGLYSKRYRRLADLPAGAQVAIPNDPSNGGRVLLLLQQAGLIRLKTGIDPVAGVFATRLDITDNPRQLRLVEIDAPQLPRSLDDVDAAAINADFANKAGLNPVRDSILLEDRDGPYACLIAVREKDKDERWVQQLVQSYQTEEVRQFILKEFNGVVIPAF
ncbi:MAG: MetQ/NlpA family ABC transporter substrate-binding protein [Curvibacter sp.]|nr:MetQ/NlpA family ABC transporter substrate-binding protein [Curvibacter sp.]